MNRVSPEAYALHVKHPVILMLHNVRSMWNVGSMFRSADAAGIEKVILSGFTAVPPRKEIDKTALGAQNSVCWEHHPDPMPLLDTMKQEGISLFALEITTESRLYTDVTPEDFPLCLIVGNEVGGIDDEILSKCDGVLEIPQYGTKHSLNVAVASGIALFEMVRVLRWGK